MAHDASIDQPKHFPANFDVRFAEYLKHLIAVCLDNLPACRLALKWLVDNVENDREKRDAEAKLLMWDDGSAQVWLSALIYDVCVIFTTLQK